MLIRLARIALFVFVIASITYACASSNDLHGWAAKNSVQQNPTSPSEQAGVVSDRRTVFEAYPYPTQDSCYFAPDHDATDLCAQWRAAHAAERSANYGLLSLVLSALGMLGLVTTLWQTSKSLDEARRSADASELSSAVTREIGEAQARCYLALSDAKVALYAPDFKPRLSFKIANVGQSPALKLRWKFQAQFSTLEQPDRRGGVTSADYFELNVSPSTTQIVGPNVLDFSPNAHELGWLSSVTGRQLGFSVKLIIEAVDVFGKPVTTEGFFAGGISGINQEHELVKVK